jgi:hypothetical protein
MSVVQGELILGSSSAGIIAGKANDRLAIIQPSKLKIPQEFKKGADHERPGTSSAIAERAL